MYISNTSSGYSIAPRCPPTFLQTGRAPGSEPTKRRLRWMYQISSRMLLSENGFWMSLHKEDTVLSSLSHCYLKKYSNMALGEKKRQRRSKDDQTEVDTGVSADSATVDKTVSDSVDKVLSQSSSDTNTLPLFSSATMGTFDLGMDSWNSLADTIQMPELTLASNAENAASTSGESSDCNASLGFFFGSMGSSTQSLDSLSNISSDSLCPDSYLLPVHELTLLKACMRISQQIGCDNQLWRLDAVSPFHAGVATPSDQLPLAWRPTPAQVLIKHHPVLDFLPWASVREKVIGIFSLPDELRPPSATGALAMINFVYDFEDSAEGVRIYGDDPYDPGSWEVGQLFFERWWFLFDREIVENSNRWRKLRGAEPLAIRDQGEPLRTWKHMNRNSSPETHGMSWIALKWMADILHHVALQISTYSLFSSQGWNRFKGTSIIHFYLPHAYHMYVVCNAVKWGTSVWRDESEVKDAGMWTDNKAV